MIMSLKGLSIGNRVGSSSKMACADPAAFTP